MKKRCKKCEQTKILKSFYFRNDTKKYRDVCKTCHNKNNRTLYEKNSEIKIKYQKNYYNKNIKKICQYKKEYNRTHKKKIKEYNAKYKKEHKNDINMKIATNLRRRINCAIKHNQKSGSAVEDLGCSIKNLKSYFESKFYPNPTTNEMMSWENYGYYGWHIDHIVPLHTFDLTDPKQFKKATHYTNLQPLWAEDHIKKHSN